MSLGEGKVLHWNAENRQFEPVWKKGLPATVLLKHVAQARALHQDPKKYASSHRLPVKGMGLWLSSNILEKQDMGVMERLLLSIQYGWNRRCTITATTIVAIVKKASELARDGGFVPGELNTPTDLL